MVVPAFRGGIQVWLYRPLGVVPRHGCAGPQGWHSGMVVLAFSGGTLAAYGLTVLGR